MPFFKAYHRLAANDKIMSEHQWGEGADSTATGSGRGLLTYSCATSSPYSLFLGEGPLLGPAPPARTFVTAPEVVTLLRGRARLQHNVVRQTAVTDAPGRPRNGRTPGDIDSAGAAVQRSRPDSTPSDVFGSPSPLEVNRSATDRMRRPGKWLCLGVSMPESARVKADCARRKAMMISMRRRFERAGSPCRLETHSLRGETGKPIGGDRRRGTQPAVIRKPRTHTVGVSADADARIHPSTDLETNLEEPDNYSNRVIYIFNSMERAVRNRHDSQTSPSDAGFTPNRARS